MATYDIFVSYCHNDSEAVNAFADALRREGLEAWILPLKLRLR